MEKLGEDQPCEDWRVKTMVTAVPWWTELTEEWRLKTDTHSHSDKWRAETCGPIAAIPWKKGIDVVATRVVRFNCDFWGILRLNWLVFIIQYVYHTYLIWVAALKIRLGRELISFGECKYR